MAIDLPIGVAAFVLATLVMAATSAAETALERANHVRIQALAAQGHPKAIRIAGDVTQPRAFLASLTTARVLSAGFVVALAAWLGAGAFGPLGALAVGMIGATWSALVQMTVGLVAARQPEYAAIQLGGLVRVVNLIVGGPAWVLSLPARLVARSIRAVTRDSYTDLLALVEREEAAGRVDEYEKRMIRGVIELEAKTAREIMVPRIDMVVAEVSDSIIDIARTVTEKGYSRIPVFRESIDDICGIVYAKDLLRIVSNGGRQKLLADLMRQVFFIPESKRLDELLTEMQSKRVHLAIVVDEYGGTAGLVTIEDLIEEIVGEIEDEYDIAGPRTEIVSEDIAIVDGAVSTDILDELFDHTVESDDYDTVGGFVMHHLGRLPKPGDVVHENGLTLEVLSVRGRRVGQVRIERASAEEPDQSPEAAISRSA